MANRTLQQNKDLAVSALTAIRDSLRENGADVPVGTPATAYASKVNEVNTAGFKGAYNIANPAIIDSSSKLKTRLQGDSAESSVTYNKIFEEGIEIGKKNQYDAFWNSYQQNGSRTDYDYAFAGQGWATNTFSPEYDMRVTRAMHMFARTSIAGDLAQTFKEKGIIFDTSNCKFFVNMFVHATGITRIPEINLTSMDLSTSAYYNGIFQNANKLITIDKLIVNDSVAWSGTFIDCDSLVNLEVEGTIGKNGFDVSWSPLSKASLTSIINALSSTATGLTVRLRLSAVNKAFETSDGLDDGSTSEEWTTLIANKPNWNINLIDS